MENQNIDPEICKKAELWLNSGIDEHSKSEIRQMMQNDIASLNEAFYKDLEFGTGGMRGIMGTGSNRMNIYTVGMASQGLANYVKANTKEVHPSAAIAYDCRNNSRLFAETTASVLSANGIKVYLFDALRPTPELSFAIRQLHCQCGIVITASHNPREYNGYKVYWQDGGQIVAPHDKGIISQVQAINTPDKINTDSRPELQESIGKEIDELYINEIKKLSLSPKEIQAHQDMPIVFTPLHGTAVKLVPESLKAFGFTNIIKVPEQDIPDGNFPTVKSPNPEETSAFEMALQKARETNAELIMGTDPDADRVGIIVRKKDGEYQMLNGNQTAAILYYYLLTRWQEKGKIKGREFTVKTIVTTELLAEIADDFNVKSYDTLTGFKYIAAKIRDLENLETFVVGGEESYGYLVGDFVRDKDAVISCAIIAEAAAWAKDQGKTLWDILMDIYAKFGIYKEELISIKKEGRAGEAAIKEMMEEFRNNPPDSINGVDIAMVNDFLKQKAVDKISDLRYDINLPKSNVLQYIMVDGTKISIRPSGTEPKIKFYVSVRDKPGDISEYDKKDKQLKDKIERILKKLL
ncbi:MAG: phospho-sugar mutase [Bacteroidota bacterium]